MNKNEKISIRLTPYQGQVLSELSKALNTSISMLVRSIVGDFITRNEERLERIIVSKLEGDANHKQTTEEIIFSEEGD